jgi:hypothetical protein
MAFNRLAGIFPRHDKKFMHRSIDDVAGSAVVP